MTEDHQISVEDHDSATLLSVVSERIDYMVVARAKRIVSSAANLAFQKSVILDLAKVECVSSMVIGALIDLFRHCQKTGQRLFLVGLNDQVRGVVSNAGLDRFFEIREDPDAALRTLAQPGR